MTRPTFLCSSLSLTTGLLISVLGSVAATLVLISAPDVAHAQAVDVARTPTWDVLELKDGSIYKGVIVEQTPGQTYKLAMLDGSIRVFPSDQIVKISKEANPGALAAPMPARTSSSTMASEPAWQDGGQAGDASARHGRRGGAGMPKPYAMSGLRFGAEALVLFPTGNWKGADTDSGEVDFFTTSFAPRVRFGYEALKGNIGLGGGVQTTFIPWLFAGDADDDFVWSLEAHAYGKLALHMGKVAPYAGMSMGFDHVQYTGAGNDDDEGKSGFGMNVDFGVDAFVSETIQLGLGGSVKAAGPEFFDGAFGPRYFGLRLGMTANF